MEIVNEYNLIVYKGEQVIIPCMGVPPNTLYVEWRKDADYMFLGFSPRIRLPRGMNIRSKRIVFDGDSYSLFIRDIIKRDEGEYRCIVGHDDITNVPRVTMTRLRVVERERTIYATTGANVTLSCDTTNSATHGISSLVRWTKDAVLISTVSEPDTDARLVVENATRDDDGTYVCVLETTKLDGVATYHHLATVYLLVQGHSSITVAAGSSVSLPCELSGEDARGSGVEWTFQASPSDSGVLFMFNHSVTQSLMGRRTRFGFPLVLKSVGLKDSGVYTCSTAGFTGYYFDRASHDHYVTSVHVTVK